MPAFVGGMKYWETKSVSETKEKLNKVSVCDNIKFVLQVLDTNPYFLTGEKTLACKSFHDSSHSINLECTQNFALQCSGVVS